MSRHAPARISSFCPIRFFSTSPTAQAPPRSHALTPTTEPRDPRKPRVSYTQRTITPPRRPDARLSPYTRSPTYYTTPNINADGTRATTRATKLHHTRIFVPHSPLPRSWLGKAPSGTKPYDPADPPIFHVGRTGSQNLPVYVEKLGTPSLRVAVRLVSGSKSALARALAAAFDFATEKVVAHPTSAQVLIKVRFCFGIECEQKKRRILADMGSRALARSRESEYWIG